MTHTPRPGHRQVVEDALADWWITTDLAQAFEPPAVANHIETYLISSGYTITPDAPRTSVPTRLSITVTSLLVVACLASSAASALRDDWAWAAIGLTAGIAYTHELLRDLTDRRHHRTARPTTLDRTKNRQR